MISGKSLMGGHLLSLADVQLRQHNSYAIKLFPHLSIPSAIPSNIPSAPQLTLQLSFPQPPQLFPHSSNWHLLWLCTTYLPAPLAVPVVPTFPDPLCFITHPLSSMTWHWGNPLWLSARYLRCLLYLLCPQY